MDRAILLAAVNHKLRILVVDDQHPVLLTYTLVLQQQGHEVTGAASCEGAVECLQEGSYDLLVCDFGLNAGRSGFDVIDFARQVNPRIASVLLTGYSNPEIDQQAQQRGVTVLHKPMGVRELLMALDGASRARGAA